MTEQQKVERPLTEGERIAKMADSMPEELPYGVREALASLQLEGEVKAQVPEGIFVRDILPVLCGEEGDVVDMKWWGGRFGSPFKDFQVISDSTGEVLFTVPPLLDRNFELVPPSDKRDTVNEATASFRQRAYNNPMRAKEELKTSLRRRINLRTAVRPVEHMKTLDAIFKRYGKPSIFEQAADEEVRKLAATPKPGTSAATTEPETPEVYQDYSDDGLLD